MYFSVFLNRNKHTHETNIQLILYFRTFMGKLIKNNSSQIQDKLSFELWLKGGYNNDFPSKKFMTSDFKLTGFSSTLYFVLNMELFWILSASLIWFIKFCNFLNYILLHWFFFRPRTANKKDSSQHFPSSRGLVPK